MPAPGTLRIWGFQVASACSMRRTPSRSPALSVSKNLNTNRSLSVLASTLIAFLQASLRREAHGQSFRAVPDGGHPGFRRTRRLERLDVACEGANERLGLETGKYPANAGMDTQAPTEVSTIVAPHIEIVGLLPLAWIAVRGCEHESAAL